jgi:hypothetical protein
MISPQWKIQAMIPLTLVVRLGWMAFLVQGPVVLSGLVDNVPLHWWLITDKGPWPILPSHGGDLQWGAPEIAQPCAPSPTDKTTLVVGQQAKAGSFGQVANEVAMQPVEG